MLREPLGSALVTALLVLMHRPVDLDRQVQPSAVEIKDIGPDGMLAAEVQAAAVAAEQGPEGALWFGHGTTK